jgi:DNA-binding HxlR family transcriptional regulator
MDQPHHCATPHICSNFHDTIEFIGKRWTGIIIYTLMSGPKRFHEIVESIPGISDRLLTERLNELVKEGLVIKKHLDSSVKKVEYELTPSGMALKEVIIAIRNWAETRTNKSN